VLAIVGPNGSGKSTLVYLMLKFYLPQQGAIHLDTTAMAEADTASWRNRFAVVTRDPAIFSLTVAENIALGRPDATAAEIEAAAKAVRLHDVIEKLSGGYGAQVGESGVRLSAGQRQRLALARIFLQDPSVIILDEATTSLDRDSEEALAEAMRQWIGRRTLIIISHQPITQWPVTRTLRLEAGRIVSGE
jgi:ATP-binding cassette subfamily B protein